MDEMKSRIRMLGPGGIILMLALLVIWLVVPAASAQTVRYVHTDGLGSVAVVTDQNRNVVERREYEPYGVTLTGLKDGPGYAGHVGDAQTGLSYMQQRYYDPQVGRFLSVDPITAYGSHFKAFNRFAYAANNPYGFIDPDGRQVLPLPLPPVIPPPPIVQNTVPDDLSRPVTLGEVVVRAIDRKIEEKTYVTYTLTKEGDFGKVTYVGRASGYGTPEEVMARRYARHYLRRLEGYGSPQLDKSATGEAGRLAIRGREQQKIDNAGGVGTEGVGNVIRGVSVYNTFGPVYHEASNEAFGPLAPYTGNGTWWDEF